MLKYNLSDAYIEAKLYRKYSYLLSLKDINVIIDKVKKHIYKNDIDDYFKKFLSQNKKQIVTNPHLR